MADDFGFQPETPKSDDFGFQPIPKLPDISGIQRTAQDNLAANDNKDTETAPKPQTPSERLDTALGMPISSLLKPDNNTPLPAPMRRQLTKSYANGSATDAGDFMQTAMRGIMPVVAGMVKTAEHPIDTLEDVAKTAGSSLAKSEAHILTSTPASLASDVMQNTINLPVQGATRLAGKLYESLGGELSLDAAKILTQGIPEFGGFKGQREGRELINKALDYEPHTAQGKVTQASLAIAPYLAAGEGSLLRKTAGSLASGIGTVAGEEEAKSMGFGEKGQQVGAILGGFPGMAYGGTTPAKPQFPPGTGPWEIVKQTVGNQLGKPPEAVTPTDSDNAIAGGTKNIPAAKDFKSVETVTDGALNEKTLHVIYNDTGVKPDQVFADAQSNPEIAQEVSAGKIPEAYEHLVEPREVNKPEKLIVSRDEDTKSFSVTDANGDHVQGGFDSYEEAKHFIEDKKFEAEERVAIEEEPAPKVENAAIKEIDKGGGHYYVLNSEGITAGTIYTRENLNGDIQINLASVIPEEGRKGYFTKAYKELADKAIDSGKFLVSDTTVTSVASKLYKKLEELGYKVEKSPLARETKNGDISTFSDNEPVYKVTEKPKPTTEKTAAGEQSVIPGTEKITDKALAERKMEGAKQAEVTQKPANEGLFDVGARSQSDLFNRKPAVIPPSEIGKPTSLRTFLSNNGAKFNENNELVSIKKNGERVSGEAALEHANEMAKEHGYLPENSANEPSKTFKELQNLLTEKNGGREAFRTQDAERVLKSAENKKARERADPAYIEYQAHNIGLDTERLKGETDKQFLDRLLKGLEDFYKSQEGSGGYLRKIIGDTIIAAEKFVGKLTGNLFEKMADGYIKTFQPELLGPLAKRADAFLAKFKAAGQEAENSYYRQSAASKAEFNRLTPDERMEWLYDHETGRWNTEENPDHARFQAVYDAMHKAEQEAIGQETAYKENYLPHQWEQPDAVKAFFRSDAMIKKYGADWFKKASEFRLIQEGVRAGFKLKTDNPESMLVARQLASDNMIRTMNLLKDMESSGIAKRVSAFSIDKKIAKTETAIAELKEKYKKEFDKANDPNQMRMDNVDPAVSKKMKIVEKRLVDLQKRLDDFNKEKAENKLTPDEMKALKNGFRVIGPDSKVWNIHQEVGPLWKNAMEMKGLWENQGVLGDFYRGYIQGKAQWVKTKLSLSLFHPFHEVDIHVASRLASAAEHLIKGGKISDLSLADTGAKMGITRNTLGLKDHPQIVSWNTPDALRTPEQKADVQRMIEGGMNPIMSARDTVRFRENWDKAISGVGVNNLRLITAALELPGKALSPLFEHWIPGLKVDSYFRQTELALKRDPTLANDAGRRGEVFRKISQDIDRNYGEMNSDTQFWNKTVRDTFNAAFISGGWKLAMLQNARGLLEPAKMAYNFAKTGEFSKEAITHQMLQSYFYTAIVLAQGAVLTYLFTGTAGNIKDWIFPDTGDKNPDGTPIRLTQPAFLKEYLMLGRDINEMGDVPGIGHFLYHQTLIPGIVDTLNNRDYLGRPTISDPTDLNQWATAGWDFIKPITVSGYEKAQSKQSEIAQNMNLAGFPLAGAWVNQTPFEQKVLHTYSEQNPPKGSSYEAKLKADLKSALANNKTEDVEEIKQKMKEEGMSQHQIESAGHTFTKPFVDVAWSKLSHQDQERLIKSASDEEKAKFKVKSP